MSFNGKFFHITHFSQSTFGQNFHSNILLEPISNTTTIFNTIVSGTHPSQDWMYSISKEYLFLKTNPKKNFQHTSSTKFESSNRSQHTRINNIHDKSHQYCDKWETYESYRTKVCEPIKKSLSNRQSKATRHCRHLKSDQLIILSPSMECDRKSLY